MSLVSSVRKAVFRNFVVHATHWWYRRVYGMHIGEHVRISRGARLDKTNPAGVHIGDHTAVTSGAAIVTHDFVNRTWKDVYIGRCCFLGYGCIVLPGVTIGDHCIVSGNSVVGRDVPSNSVVMGNPARVVERDIMTGHWGIRLDKGNASEIAY